MGTMFSREIFTKKCRQQQIFDSDLKGAWHYNHVTFTPIAKNFMLYCRLIYMFSILCVRLTIKVKVGIPESFKVGWYPLKKTGSSHLKSNPSKEDIKQILRDELNIWTETSQNNEKYRRVNRKFRSCNFPVHCGGTVFGKKPKLGRYRNFKPYFKRLHRRNNTQNVFNQGKIGARLNWLAPLSCVVVNP